jgi:hypothetical protein
MSGAGAMSRGAATSGAGAMSRGVATSGVTLAAELARAAEHRYGRRRRQAGTRRAAEPEHSGRAEAMQFGDAGR